MNLLANYQDKIFLFLKKLEKKNIIKIPKNFKGFVVELPPKGQKGEMTCNASLLLAKENSLAPIEIAEILKKKIIRKFQ